VTCTPAADGPTEQWWMATAGGACSRVQMQRWQYQDSRPRCGSETGRALHPPDVHTGAWREVTTQGERGCSDITRE
jgi:hypothetical protein